MSQLSEKEYLHEFGAILDRIRKDATPFRNDSTAKQQARKKRAKSDKLFFAATYFPHYIALDEEYCRRLLKQPSGQLYLDPDAEINWVKAGFAESHVMLRHQRVTQPFEGGLFDLPDVLKQFTIVAGYRECAKSTLLGKIEPLWKLLFEDRWFILTVSRTEKKAETKVVPLKIELEENIRLRNDFGDLVGKRQWENGFIVTNTGRAVKSLSRDQSPRGEEINGHRYDHFIIDDISDPDLPDSPDIVQKKVDWIKRSLLEGVNSPRWSGLMLTNWTMEGDITDELIRGKNTSHFQKVIIRVLVPNDLRTDEEKRLAKECKAVGLPSEMKSEWEFRHPTVAELRKRKQDPDTHDNERMMQPRQRGGKVFYESWFKFHTRRRLALSGYTMYTFVDPSGTEPGDAKAVITVGVGVVDGRLHIPVLKCDMQQQDIDWMLETTWRHFIEFRPIVVGVADNAYKDFVNREYLRLMATKKSPLPFLPINQVGNKHGRIARLAPQVKDGTITFDLEDPDQEWLIRQLKSEPDPGKCMGYGIGGDDGSDALEGGVTLITDYPMYGQVDYQTVQRRQASFGRGAY
jgi:hypothetical protein